MRRPEALIALLILTVPVFLNGWKQWGFLPAIGATLGVWVFIGAFGLLASARRRR